MMPDLELQRSSKATKSLNGALKDRSSSLIGSPMCTSFTEIQRFSWSRMSRESAGSAGTYMVVDICGLRISYYGDDFVVLAPETQLDRFRKQMTKRYSVEFKARLGGTAQDDQAELC